MFASLLVALQPVSPARADGEAREPTTNGPVLVAHQETRVLALLAPYRMGGPVDSGWSVGDVAIESSAIRIELVTEGRTGQLRLRHPSADPDAPLRSRHFVLDFEPTDLPAPVRDALTRAIQRNDQRSLWSEPPDGPPRILHALGGFDTALYALVGLLFVIAAVVRQLLGLPRPAWLALFGITLVGVLVRLFIAVEAPMNAWSYARVVPAARWLYESQSLAHFAARRDVPVPLVDVIFRVDFVMACLTPPMLFAHARAVLRDHRMALVAALLLATLPMHVRFSRSDVEFVQSLLASSMTFVALYGALADTSRAWRTTCQIVLPMLCVTTYLTRPENMIFFPLDFGALYVTARGATMPRARVALVASLVIVPAMYAITQHLVPRYAGNVSDGLQIRTLVSAVATVLHPVRNTLVNPSMTPPWLAPLAILGFIVLSRRGDRARAIFLATWLAAFFVVESYVQPPEVAMQARYHLHLVTPFVLLAAAALPWLLDRSKLAVGALVVGSLAAPLLYQSAIRHTGFYEMREFAFLREATRRIPAGCTVLEYRGAVEPWRGGRQHDSKFVRFGAALVDGRADQRFRVIAMDSFESGGSGRLGTEVVADEARQVLSNPPACTLVYLGLSCVTQRVVGEHIASVCEQVRMAGRLEPVAETIIRGRVYDTSIVGHDFRPLPHGTPPLLPPDTPVSLGLFRYGGPVRAE